MLDLAGQRGCHVLGDITLKVRRDGYLTLDLAGLEDGGADLLYALLFLQSRGFFLAASHETQGSKGVNKNLFLSHKGTINFVLHIG